MSKTPITPLGTLPPELFDHDDYIEGYSGVQDNQQYIEMLNRESELLHKQSDNLSIANCAGAITLCTDKQKLIQERLTQIEKSIMFEILNPDYLKNNRVIFVRSLSHGIKHFVINTNIVCGSKYFTEHLHPIEKDVIHYAMMTAGTSRPVLVDILTVSDTHTVILYLLDGNMFYIDPNKPEFSSRLEQLGLRRGVEMSLYISEAKERFDCSHTSYAIALTLIEENPQSLPVLGKLLEMSFQTPSDTLNNIKIEDPRRMSDDQKTRTEFRKIISVMYDNNQKKQKRK